jgi:hypothetical protein
MSKEPSLRARSTPTKRQELAATNSPVVTDRIVTLDPVVVHSGGLAELLEFHEREIKELLAESIRTAGQKLPCSARLRLVPPIPPQNRCKGSDARLDR